MVSQAFLPSCGGGQKKGSWDSYQSRRSFPMTATYAQAVAEVKARVNASRTSFHAGRAMLPKARREAMYALYAFCREVDDIADDGATVEERRRGLLQWHMRI